MILAAAALLFSLYDGGPVPPGIDHLLVLPGVAVPSGVRATRVEPVALRDIRQSRGPLLVIRAGVWPRLRPGIEVEGERDVGFANATAEPWVDSNGWVLRYARAIEPRRPIILVYRPEKGARPRPASAALAIAEAAVFGGAFACPVSMLSDARAMAVRSFVDGHEDWFTAAPEAPVAVLAEKLDPVAEVMNLLVRRNVPFVALTREAFAHEAFTSEAFTSEAVSREAFTSEAVSRKAVTAEGVSREGVPGKAVPREGLSREAVTGERVTRKAAPREAVSRETVTGEGVPREAVPGDRSPYKALAVLVSVGQPPLTEAEKSRLAGATILERPSAPDPNRLAIETRAALGDRRPFRLANAQQVIASLVTLGGGKRVLHLLNYGIDPIQDVRIRLARPAARAMLFAPGMTSGQPLETRSGEFAVPEMGVYAAVVLED